jgi:outer membrane lipoprotein-sorting protein
MRSVRIGRCVLSISFTLLCAGPALAGPNANEIFKKCLKNMTDFKTYQGVWHMSMTMGQMGAMAVSLDMKMLKSSEKMSLKVAPLGQPTGMLMSASGDMSALMVDDGKNLYRYMPARNQYSKNPHRADALVNPALDLVRQFANANYRLQKTVKLNGRPTYVLQVIPKKDGASAAAITMFVDQATYQFKQMAISNNMPAMAQGQSPQKMDVKMSVEREVVNGSISPSEFKFTPPKGAVEVKGGEGMSGSMMGPMLGGGGPGRPRR